MKKRTIGHVTEAPHGAADDARAVGERAKTKQAHAVLCGHGRGLSGRHAKSNLDTVNRLARERFGQSARPKPLGHRRTRLTFELRRNLSGGRPRSGGSSCWSM